MVEHRPLQADDPVPGLTLYSIGHSNHGVQMFRGLLIRYGIQVVVDVRSSPYSRFVPQANRESLAQALASAGIAYRWLGDSLGGKPGGVPADYSIVRETPAFRQGIAELLSLARAQPTAFMCSEGDHRACHRYRLITPALLGAGAHVLHIQPDGTVVDENEEPRQLSLF